MVELQTMKRKRTIRRLPKTTARLALALRDIELGVRRANRWLSVLASFETAIRTEDKMKAYDEARREKFEVEAIQAEFLTPEEESIQAQAELEETTLDLQPQSKDTE